MAAEDEVRQASERFYAALNRMLEESDTGPMGEIWSHGSDVSAMHPFGGRMGGGRGLLGAGRASVLRWASGCG